MTVAAVSTETTAVSRPGKVLWSACGAHALHDGLTDTLYLLLPIFQAEFALSYAAIGVLRALYAGTMAALQVPASRLAGRFGGALLLALGTAIAGIGYLLMGLSGSVVALGAALVLGGIGSSTQHPIASSLVAGAYHGARSRAALGTYNFAGDVGKMALPSLTALLITIMAWRGASAVVGLIGIVGAGAIMVALRDRQPQAAAAEGKAKAASAGTGRAAGGFGLLLSIGIIDSATRMGFLTFLPFLLQAKGAGLPTVGVALTLVFAGGAAGKLVCGFLGARIGVLATVLITEGATAIGILALLPLPIEAALAVLPVIGIALNGTSSVLYGTVPELVPPERRERAFGIFYTGTIGAGALSPAIYGLFSDQIGLTAGMLLVAAFVLLTLPLAYRLRRSLDALPA